MGFSRNPCTCSGALRKSRNRRHRRSVPGMVSGSYLETSSCRSCACRAEPRRSLSSEYVPIGMKILFDQGTPVPLKDHLNDHTVQTAFELGWSNLENGALLAVAEDAFDLLITTDQQLRYQQNLAGRKIKCACPHDHKLAAHPGSSAQNYRCAFPDKIWRVS